MENLFQKQIKTFGRGIEFVAPDYMFLSEYQDSEGFQKIYKKSPIYDGGWFQELSSIFNEIKAISNIEQAFLINIALYTYQQSLTEKYVDFSFPSLVRSIETLVTLGPGQGRGLFAKRVAHVLPPKDDLKFVFKDAEIKTIIKNTYGLRSDAIHGKKFGSLLGSDNKEFLNHEVHRYHYLLQTTAKSAIRKFLGNEDLKKAAKSREGLEAYWDSVEPDSDKPCVCSKHPRLKVFHPESDK